MNEEASPRPFSNTQLMACRALYPIIGFNGISECPFSRSARQYKVRNCRGTEREKEGAMFVFVSICKSLLRSLPNKTPLNIIQLCVHLNFSMKTCNTSRQYENILNNPQNNKRISIFVTSTLSNIRQLSMWVFTISEENQYNIRLNYPTDCCYSEPFTYTVHK